jgi:cell wall assembly regulator SMI1
MTSERMDGVVTRIAEILTATYKLEDHGAGVSRSILPPPALPKEITSFERKHDLRFPPSYRQFLELHNGWEHFWIDMTLIGVSGKHTVAVLEKVKETIEWQGKYLATKLGELTPKKILAWEKRSNLYLASHFPFATSFAGEFLVFDRSTVTRNGEMQVVFWNIGSGVDENERHEDFAELLESVAKRVEAHYNKITKSRGAKAKKK